MEAEEVMQPHWLEKVALEVHVNAEVVEAHNVERQAEKAAFPLG